MAADRFGRWASLLFGAFLLLDLVAFLAVIGAEVEPSGAGPLLAAGLVIGGVALYATIVALAREKPWAAGVAVAILVLIFVSGIVDLVSNLSVKFTIPIGSLLAVAILVQPRPQGDALTRPLRAAAPIAIIAGFALATVWPVVAAAALRPGASPLAVGQNALSLEAKVECGTTITDGAIVATVNWRWRERDLFPGSTDGLFVQWAPIPDEADSHFDQDASTASDGVWSGSGSPAATLIQPLEQSGQYGGFTTFGIDVAAYGQTDGFVRLVLHPDLPDVHGSIVVSAAYAHLDRWLRWTEVATCRW